MASTAEQQAADVGQRLEARASQLAGRTSAEKAGRVIEDGIRGKGGFVDKFHGTQKLLYDELDNYVPVDSPVTVSNTQNTLSTITKIIAGAEKTSERLVNPALKKIADDLAQDASSGTIPFQALKSLRTMVGEKLSTVSLTDDIPRAQWKRLYGALSDDLKEAAKNSGDPKAMQAWNRANNYTRAGYNRIDKIESVLKRKGGPEKIFQAATSSTKEGATTLRSVMQSLDQEGQKVVTATVLRRLGLAKAGVQNEVGEQFSSETLLTNWNLLSKEAKSTLFDRYGPSFRADMDAVAKFAANLREGSQVFRNPSGTAQAAAQYTTAGAFVMAALTGNVGAAAAVGGAVVGANRMAALMTKPEFVKWLAQTTKVPAGALPAQVNALSKLAEGDPDIAWAVALLEESQNDQANGENGR
jgi:hypothetical protein